MDRYKTLRNYLERYKKGGFGWKVKYDKEVNLEQNGYAWLAGHMNSMLDDMIKIFGADRCLRVVKEFEWIDGQGYVKNDPK